MNTYLFAGYLVIWTVLFSYVFYLARKQKQVHGQLKSVLEKLQKSED